MEIASNVSSTARLTTPSLRSSTPRLGLKRYEGHREKLDFFRHASHRLSVFNQIKSTSVGDLHRCRSNLESLFCYDKSIPEEIIEKPVGLSMGERNIGENPRCEECHAKGAVLCATCSGSGLYIDSILESQGILVKVRCLGENHTSHYLCEGMPFSSHVYYHCYFCDFFVSFSIFRFIRSYYSISQSFLIFSLFLTPATIGRRRR